MYKDIIETFTSSTKSCQKMLINSFATHTDSTQIKVIESFSSRNKLHSAFVIDSKTSNVALWCSGYITAAQLHSAKSEFRFCAGSNPVRGMSEIHGGEDL